MKCDSCGAIFVEGDGADIDDGSGDVFCLCRNCADTLDELDISTDGTE